MNISQIPRRDTLPVKPKRLDQVRTVMRLRGFSDHTDETDVAAASRFILSHDKEHPADRDPQAILTYLTNERNVAATTRNWNGSDARSPVTGIDL